MTKTKIPWVRNPDGTQGYTWNPITGCLGPNGTPQNPKRCSYCYAHKLAKGRLKQRYLSACRYLVSLPPGASWNDPFSPRFWFERLDEPAHLGKPSTIFVCSMGELFSEYYPPHWSRNILCTLDEAYWHTYLLLTKNSYKAADFAFPDNVWLGVTVNSVQDWFRVWSLKSCKAKIKFISFEPLLDNAINTTNIVLDWIDWVIVGAQTRPDLKPHHDWVYNIIDKARKEGVPVFLKDNLHWEEEIQEFPTLGAKICQ